MTVEIEMDAPHVLAGLGQRAFRMLIGGRLVENLSVETMPSRSPSLEREAELGALGAGSREPAIAGTRGRLPELTLDWRNSWRNAHGMPAVTACCSSPSVIVSVPSSP